MQFLSGRKALLAVCSASLLISACATTDNTARLQNENELREARAAQAQLQAENQRARQEIAAREQTIAALRNRPAPAAPAPRNTGDDQLPPNAKPGECYARVVIPAQYRTSNQRVLARGASERIEVIPAKYAPATERVLVKEASTRLEVVPATYRNVTERVLVRPASTRLVEVPATYRTESERILVSPARTEWKRGTGRGSQTGNNFGGAAEQVDRFEGRNVLATRVEDTGELMCLVEIPAQYRTVTRRVVDRPATTRTVEIPAEYKTVTRRVVDRPASTREVTIPAQYTTIKTTRVVEPASERRITIPEQYKTVTKRELVSDESREWRPVLCEVNMTDSNIVALQRALKAKGCYKCAIDGVMGPCTIRAAQCYARPRNLPAGDKYITIEVIKSLGLNFKNRSVSRY